MSTALPELPSLPPSQIALIQDTEGNPTAIKDAAIPELQPGMLLVKVEMMALNPCDYKMGAAFPSEGVVIGNDFVGTVVRIHPNVSTEICIGDRVCGLVHGSNPGDRSNGAFAQYVRVPADLALRVPAGFKTEHAATLGSGLTTSIVALWEGGLDLGVSLEKPTEDPFPVLVYGGSTATGTIALQLLRLSGLAPITTCSPRNFELVRSYGADLVLDYTDPDLASKIRSETGSGLEYALNIITDRDSIACCFASISRFGG
jgi:NADPH:quinone reductase-like Zn-dependent oxidoreductase